MNRIADDFAAIAANLRRISGEPEPSQDVCDKCEGGGVPVTFDEDGCPDEREVKWFKSLAEAKAARAHLESLGVWRMAPGLWCDKRKPDMIAVAEHLDNALDVYEALLNSGDVPAIKGKTE